MAKARFSLTKRFFKAPQSQIPVLYSPKDPEVDSFHHLCNTAGHTTATLNTLKKEMCSVLDVGTPLGVILKEVKYNLGILF